MLQTDRRMGLYETFSVTPVLRFFYGEHLVEVGMSLKGEWRLHYELRL